jgi:anti-sigma factor RsiW
MNHLTLEMLQEYLDGLTDDDTRNKVEMHIQSCTVCSDEIKLLRSLDSSLKNIPHEKASPNFTIRVIKQLGIRESPSIVWLIFKNLAPLFGLVAIISVIYGVLKFTGSLDSSGVSESVAATQLAYDSVADGISTGISAFSGWVKNTFPFLYTNKHYTLTAFIAVLFIIVALLDKFVFMPIVRRRL